MKKKKEKGLPEAVNKVFGIKEMIILSQISIKTNAVISANGGLKRDISKLSSVDDRLSSLEHDVDSRIKARRNIHSRMHNACNSVSNLEGRLRSLEAYVGNSVNSYVEADNYLNNKANSVGSALRPEKKSFWDRLKVGIGAVVAKAKEVWATFKRNIEPGGKWYKPYQIGKAVVGIGIGIFSIVEGIGTIIGSGVAEVFSGGAVTPLAVLTAMYGATQTLYGINQTVSSTYDLVYALQGKCDKIGKVNLLKHGAEWVGGNIGKLTGHEKEGRFVGDVAYYVGDLATVFVGAASAVNKMKKVDISKFSITGLKKEFAKISDITKTANDKLSRVRGIKQLVRAANLDILKDLKKVKTVQDISKIKAIKAITNINYGKTTKRATDIVVRAIKPISKLVSSNESNIKIGHRVYKGVTSVVKIPFKIIKDAGEMQQDNKVIFQH